MGLPIRVLPVALFFIPRALGDGVASGRFALVDCRSGGDSPGVLEPGFRLSCSSCPCCLESLEAGKKAKLLSGFLDYRRRLAWDDCLEFVFSSNDSRT